MSNKGSLPETPPVPGITRGSPDNDPVNLAFIAFREHCWRSAVERFTKAINAGDPDAKISSPLGESYRKLSAQFSNLDYWGMSRGSDQVVHSYDFFWHPGNTPLWHVRAVIDAFQGITGKRVCFEFDGLTNIAQFGYTNDICEAMAREIIKTGAGIKIANMSYAKELPSSSPVITSIGQLIKSTKVSRPKTLEPRKTVLLFFSKWANYRYREETEWLHDAQFGLWKLLTDMKVPLRVICEDNLTENLKSYKGLVMAFSPFELMPQKDRDALTKTKLRMVVDVMQVPSAPPKELIELEGIRNKLVKDKQHRITIGILLGYYYLNGADPDMCRQIMLRAMKDAAIMR